MAEPPPQATVTALLDRWTEGDTEAFEAMVPLVYDELRRVARVLLLQERRGHTLGCTALVHEAYLRLVDQSRTTWPNRAYFFGAAARAMRRVLLDHARARNAQKRGDGAIPVDLDSVTLAVDPDFDMIALDRALDELTAFDPHRARVVELRYFGGLSIEETAAIVDSSPATVKRDWAVARAWLFQRISGSPPPSES
ncbi:MAG: sigma-70 family RNA polymerase sigma factor [Bryobacteraceae bacterium]|nr:sigma-70 family RNA polymerase sigma factor [Bryobacteraceae bacterium]